MIFFASDSYAFCSYIYVLFDFNYDNMYNKAIMNWEVVGEKEV